MAGWKLVHEVIRNLGAGWQVGASGPQDLGQNVGLASGPDGMQLFFIARSERLDPCMENNCPPLGWLRVDGRLHFSDEDLSAKVSITLRESLGPEEIANQITARFFPAYREFLGAMHKQNVESQPGQRRTPEQVQAPRQETLTEEQAASYFVRSLLEKSARDWPSTYDTLKECSGNKFVVEDEKTASVNWCLAALSLGLEGVKNTFPPEQASRIQRWIFIAITDAGAVEEVKQYEAAAQKGGRWIFIDMNDTLAIAYEAAAQKGRGEPLEGVVGRLLHRWLGKNIGNCEGETLGKKTGLIDAWAMSVTLGALADLAASWNWKKINDHFELVETSSKSNEPPESLKGDESPPGVTDEDIPF